MPVFISYSHADFAIASRLHQTLTKARIDVIWDQTGISPADLLFQRIQSRIYEVDCVVALLTEKSIKSAWVRTELSLTRSLGIKVLPVLSGLDPSVMPKELRCSDERVPTELRDEVNLNCLELSSDPTPEEFGDVAKSVYAMRPSIFGSSLWRRPPEEFLHLLPSKNPGARGVLFFGALGEAVGTYGFGRHAAVCPTSPDGNLSGDITRGLLKQFPDANPRAIRVSPEKPQVIGSCGAIDFIAATVFNSEFVPRSRDQRSAAKAILKLAGEHRYSVIFIPQLGTGLTYSYPRFQAYKSFLAGVLEYYVSHTGDRYYPWIVMVLPNMNKGLFLGYNGGVTDQRLIQLCRGEFGLTFCGSNTLCSYNDTLRTFLRNARQYEPELEKAQLGIALGQGSEPLVRWPESEKKPFTYSLETKIGDTVCTDGDRLVKIQD